VNDAGPDQPPASGYDAGKRAWIFTRYADIVEVLRDTEHFSAVNSIGIEPFSSLPAQVRDVLERGLPRFPGIIEMDPPDHSRYRRLVNEGFTPRRVAALEPRMRAISEELLDDLEGQTDADFVHAFGDPLPIRVIGEILGVPPQDTDHVQHLSDAFRTFEGGTIGQLPLERQIETAERFVAFQQYVEAMVEDRRSSPGSDLVSVLAATSLENERLLSTEEIVSTVIHLLFAGQETTTRLIASMLNLLMSEPSLWERLVAEPGLAPTAIEESLRLEPPVTYHQRQAKTAISVGGMDLQAGDAIQLVFAAANRDPQVFPDPDRLDLERGNANRHLGLGRGIHFCVGAPIGRLEARVALEVLTERVPTLRLHPNETAERETHVMLSGLATLPVEWDRIEPAHAPQPVP
jgi:cytochrome P450